MTQGITHGEAAGVTETSGDNLIPPGAEPQVAPTVDPQGEIDRLEQYLVERFPSEMDLTNRQTHETPVDVALRLLTGLSTAGVTPRCVEEYCNKPSGHRDGHGWVHFH